MVTVWYEFWVKSRVDPEIHRLMTRYLAQWQARLEALLDSPAPSAAGTLSVALALGLPIVATTVATEWNPHDADSVLDAWLLSVAKTFNPRYRKVMSHAPEAKAEGEGAGENS